MNKKKINVRLIIFMAIVILIIGLIIFGIVKLVKSNDSNSGYKEITAEEYIKIAEDNNYTINDITDGMTSYSYIEKAIMAVAENDIYEIEYYLFKDETSAVNFVANKETAIYMVVGSNGNIDEAETDEYLKYSATSDSSYCTVFKIGKTVICADAKIENKDEVDKMLKKLGYFAE